MTKIHHNIQAPRTTPTLFSISFLLSAFLFFLASELLAQDTRRTFEEDPEIEIFKVVTDHSTSRMTLFGNGFSPDPKGNTVYLLDGESGVFLEVLEASSNRLLCEIKPYTSALSDSIQLQTGNGFDLPASMHHFEDRTYVADKVRWSIARREATGPSVDLPEPSEERVVSSHLVGDVLHLPLESLAFVPCSEIEIHHIVEFHTLRQPKFEPPEKDAAPPWLGMAGSLRLSFLTALPQEIASESLATDLASILNTIYGSLGLEAEAVGSDLLLRNTHGISNGFIQVSY